jgi:uncharacterized membrane protein
VTEPLQNAQAAQADLAELEGVASSIYRRVYHVLLVGMFASTALFAVGMLRALISHASVPISSHWIREQYDWETFVTGLFHLQATSLLMAATFVLILTPILRVGVSIIAFAMEGDRKFVAITSTVLAIILCTVVLARAGLVSPEHVAVKDHDADAPAKLADKPAP